MTVLDKTDLAQHIFNISGLTQRSSLVWDYDPRPEVSDVDQQLVTMKVRTSDYLGGADDKRRTYTPGVLTNQSDATYTLELTGQRTITLQLKAESYDYQVESYEILERIRTLINANFELTGFGLAYQTCNLITDLPTNYDNRVVNVAILEIQFGAVSSYVANEQIGQGWIDTVFTDGPPPDGTPVGSNKIDGTVS